jgi:hypothetical protein
MGGSSVVKTILNFEHHLPGCRTFTNADAEANDNATVSTIFMAVKQRVSAEG